jgi:putative ABC transport system ATP-binding protein
MNIIGCLDRPSSGQYFLAGQDLTTLDDDELADIRNQYIGFVFQQFNLLPKLTSLSNVMLPTIYADVDKSQLIEQVTAALVQVGSIDSRSVRVASRSEKRLRQRIQNRPNQLSGGQQHVRALVNHPALVLADEPTGALDSTTSEEIMNLLTELNQQGTTIAVVTHDANVAARTKRIIRMVDGVIVESN